MAARTLAELPSGLRHALATYKSLLEARFAGRVDVRLFGSWARGDAREDSDIDVFVAVARADSHEQSEAAAIAGDVAVDTGIWLSPVVYPTERWRWLLSIHSPFARSVEQEGIPL